MDFPADPPEDESDEAPHVPGMQRMTQEEAAKAEKAAAERAAAAQSGPLTDDRLKVLKEKARSEIEQRLKERRKKRRLMRGGDK